MSSLNVQLPESLYKELQNLARQDRVSVEQFVTLAVAEKISALTTERYLQELAKKGDRDRYDAVLAQVSDVDPEPGDRWPSV